MRVVGMVKGLNITAETGCLEKLLQEQKRHRTTHCLQMSGEPGHGRTLDASGKLHGAEPTPLCDSDSRKISDYYKGEQSVTQKWER